MIKIFRFKVTPSPECSVQLLQPGREYTIDFIDKEEKKVWLVEKPDSIQGFDFHDLLQVCYDDNGRKTLKTL